MKKIQNIVMALAVLATAASCTLNKLEDPNAGKSGQEIIFTASTPDAGGTKTEVSQNGPEILWSVNDEIIIYSGPSNNYYKGWFTSTNKEPTNQTTFSGYLDTFSGNIEEQGLRYPFFAVYPADSYDEFNGGSIFAYMPYAQNLTTGTFDPKAMLMLARSSDLALRFYNVCGGVKFKLAKEGVQQVEFTANGGQEALAGKALIRMDDLGYPTVAYTNDGPSSVVLTAAYGESFEPGKWYYIACLPAVLDQGWTMTFRTADQTGVLEHSGAAEIKRSVWAVLEEPDADATFVDEKNSVWYNVIRYTTTDEQPFEPNFGWGNACDFNSKGNAELLSNTYEDGVGTLIFNTPVTRITSRVFSDNNTLETIQLPGTVEMIGYQAFNMAQSLKEIQLNEGIREIGGFAFGWTDIDTLYVPGSVVYTNEGAFANIHSLKAFEGPWASDDGRCYLTNSGRGLRGFAPADLEGEYTVPDGVEFIQAYTFHQVSGLTGVVLPDGLTEIGPQAFYGCKDLTAVNLPSSLESLGGGAFNSCWKLASIAIPEGITEVLHNTFNECYALENVTLPSTLKEIYDSAFYSCGSLKSITLPSNLTRLGAGAFAYCSSLESITLPDSMETLQGNPFAGCASLASFAGKWASADGHFLVYDGAIVATAMAGATSITIPGTVTTIGNQAFANCQNLETIVIESGVQTIEDAAFSGCSNLQSASVPASVTTFGQNVFTSCFSLTQFSGGLAGADGRHLVMDGVLLAYAPGSGTTYTIPDGITKIGNGAFANSPIASVTFNDGLKEIGDFAFQFCSQLSAIDVPSSVTTLGNGAFNFCQKLATITLNEGLQTISNNAFYLCGLNVEGGIPEIVIPSTVTSIGSGALQTIPGVLQKVTVLPTTPPTLNGQLFWDPCPSIYVPATSVDSYKAAAEWKKYASSIQAIPAS